MATLKVIFRRAKTLLWTAFSIVVIVAAVIVGIGQLLMPYSDRYQPRLEAWLSEEFGQPVAIDSFVGEWAAFGPRLTLRGLQILPVDGAGETAESVVVIESAALDIRPLNALLPGRPLYNFRVIGADFELLRSEDGQFHLSGFGVSRREDGQERSALGDLARVGAVVLQDSSLEYIDEIYGITFLLSDINGRLHLEGNELSTEVRASLYDPRGELVYGDIDAALALTMDDDERIERVIWQATASELMLAALQGKLPANPFLPLTGWLESELWGEWSGGAGHQVTGIVDINDALVVNDYQDMNLERVNSRFRWRFKGKGNWNLHLADFLFDHGETSWTTPRLSMARNTSEDLGLWISADELPLDVPLGLARDVMSIYGTEWPAFLPDLAAGEVSELDLVLSSDWKLRLASGRVIGASVSDWGQWPDISGLAGEVNLGEGHGRISLAGDSVSLDWPRMFRAPLELTVPGCTADLSWGESWQLGLSDCSVENDDLAAAGDLVLGGNGSKPFIDANVAISRGRVGQLDPYWPEAVMKEGIKSWLRRGLTGGDIVSGRFTMRGDLDDFPFRNGEGRFEATAQIAGGSLRFLDDWPEIQDIEATARFVGAGMEIEADGGRIGGVTASFAHAVIEDFGAPVLDISYQAEQDLPGILGFLQQTPLRETINVDLSQFEFAGPVQTRGTITVPLGESPGELSVDGRAWLEQGRFTDPLRDITIDGINGELTYNEHGFRGDDLEANYRTRPARMNLSADAEQREKFRAELTGLFDVTDVIPEFLLEDFKVLNHISGVSAWNVALVVEPPPGSAENEVTLRVDSRLEGVGMDLPAPLEKAPGAAWPVRIEFPLDDSKRPLDVVFEDRATLRFDLAADESEGAADPEVGLQRALFRLDGRLAPLPEPGLVRVEGEASLVDLDGWVDVIVDEVMQGSGMGGLELEPGLLFAQEALFLDRLFTDVEMEFSVEGPEFQAVFRSEDLDGSVRYRDSDGSGNLSAEFNRLVLGDPVSSGLSMENDPAELPALHLYARSLSYAGIELGETRIEAYPKASGFHFEKVDTSSDSLSVQASGDWSLGPEGARSDFSINMASESLGDFLHSMDISSSMQGGQTLVKFDAWWPGTPAAFALSRLNGKVEFSVVDGNIANASAGTGRLLGLLSVQAIPKRLSLDFRDVFDSGFSFDEARGTFEMKNGIARTDDVELNSSAATISVRGETDLVEQRYDQELTIKPGLGNTLPIIGALAGGPVGAATGLALQGLLHKELAEASQVRYSITGSWDDPKFEPVEVERAGG